VGWGERRRRGESRRRRREEKKNDRIVIFKLKYPPVLLTSLHVECKCRVQQMLHSE
jgi:hypothetical protein